MKADRAILDRSGKREFRVGSNYRRLKAAWNGAVEHGRKIRHPSFDIVSLPGAGNEPHQTCADGFVRGADGYSNHVTRLTRPFLEIGLNIHLKRLPWQSRLGSRQDVSEPRTILTDRRCSGRA